MHSSLSRNTRHAHTLTLIGALLLILHWAGGSAFATPIVFGGHLNCSDPASCSVVVSFYYKDPATSDTEEPTLLSMVVAPVNAAGLFVAESNSDLPTTIYYDWTAKVAIKCPCYDPKTETYKLEPGGAGLADVAELAFRESLLELIARSVGAPSVPIILSTEFVAEEGAEDISLNAIANCPEPATFLLLGTPLLVTFGRTFFEQARLRRSRAAR